MSVVEVKVGTERPYSVWVGAGILERAADVLHIEKADVGALITDASLPAAIEERATAGLQPLCGKIEVARVSGGEAAKTMPRAEELARFLANAGAHRADLVAALGGGTVGDLAGFVAATYHRGMRLVQMPTTLLAMVDAAIGGKTAVNLPEGKNLVGAFHQPAAVMCDVAALDTLPREELASGLAEVVKHGLIDDGVILTSIARDRERIFNRDTPSLVDLIARAVAVKARVVSRDETEQDSRMFLNYGHTLGHALEMTGNYSRWRHGEAVAVGMMFAAHLAKMLGFEDNLAAHEQALRLCELPTRGAAEPFERIAEAMAKDKKHLHGTRFVVLEKLGMPRIVAGVDDRTLRRAYEEVA